MTKNITKVLTKEKMETVAKILKELRLPKPNIIIKSEKNKSINQ